MGYSNSIQDAVAKIDGYQSGKPIVVILAYDFPPVNSIGAQRPYSWRKYLFSSGYFPVVITRSFGRDDWVADQSTRRGASFEVDKTGAVVRVNLNGKGGELWQPGSGSSTMSRKARTGFNVISNYVGLSGGDIFSIYGMARELLGFIDASCILTTSEPFVFLKYGSRLAKEFGIPWIADYRDCWSANQAIPMSKLGRVVIALLEQEWVKRARLITTASHIYKEWLSELFPEKRIEVIYNGYFEEMHNALGNATGGEYPLLRMAYLGTLYEHQPLEEFVECVQHFHSLCKKEVVLEFWGTGTNDRVKNRIRSSVQGKGVGIRMHDKEAHAKVLKKAKEYGAVLLLSDPDRPMLYAKVFDYLALGVPIVFFKGGQDELSSIVDSVSYSFVCNSIADVVGALESIALHRVPQLTTSDREIVFKYSRRQQTQQLANLIASLR